jgi:hypothetical protein
MGGAAGDEDDAPGLGDDHHHARGGNRAGRDLESWRRDRGLGVHGYVHNPLPWRITNVRLQVDSVDANGTLIASASGWVQGDVGARGRGYFYVPIAAPAPTYRASVQAFDKVIFEAPQAP